MKKLIIGIFIFGLFITIASADDFGASDMKRAMDELKRDQMELKRNDEIMQQVERDRKQADEQLKRDAYEAKISREEAERQEKLKIRAQALAQAAKPGKLTKFFSHPVVYSGLLILLIVGLGALYYYRIVSAKKKPEQIPFTPQPLPESLLAAVNQWQFIEEDFKNYQSKLSLIVDAQVLDINSPEFKKNFVFDLAAVEILFQSAISQKLDSKQEFIAQLNEYKAYLAKLRENSNSSKQAAENYKRSFILGQAREAAFSSYYKDFLSLLILANQQEETEVYELYERQLLIEQLSGDALGLSGIIDGFRALGNSLIIKEIA